MDINRLNEFITLATQLNYSKAANQLYLTQPALSRHINDLEHTLGVKLFIRDTHNVLLTSVGEAFLTEAKIIVDHYNHAIEMVKATNEISNGKLTLGTLDIAARPFLTDFVVAFTSAHPNIKLDVYCDTMEKLVTAINNNECDAAILTHVDRKLFSGLESQQITASRMYAILNPVHPLAKRDFLTLADIANEDLINLSAAANPIGSEFNKQLFKKVGLEPNYNSEVPNVETGLFNVSLNKGIFLMPQYLIGIVGPLATIPIIDEHCYISLNLLWRKDNTNLVLPSFTNEFRSFLNNKFN